MSELAAKPPFCPTCATAMVLNAQPSKAYHCEKCEAVWLPTVTLTSAKIPVPPEPPPGTRHAHRRPCPSCHRLMALRGDSQLQVDVCVYCGGIFLDRGELAQMKEFAKRYKPPPTEPRKSIDHGLPEHDGSWIVDVILEGLYWG
jgi:Zn-finger nucleic acid-binding protein